MPKLVDGRSRFTSPFATERKLVTTTVVSADEEDGNDDGWDGHTCHFHYMMVTVRTLT